MKVFFIFAVFVCSYTVFGLPHRSGAMSLRKPFPVVGYLEQLDKVIVLKAGPFGTLYSVKNKRNQQMIVEDVTEAELLEKSPKLYAFVKRAMITGGNKPGNFLDASNL